MEAITAPQMVPGYRHLPGNHCGSTALRNLLAFHGVEISEEMALGLGAGVSFYYVPLDGQSPSRFTNGRVGRLEEQFVELTGGADPRSRPSTSPDASWEAARAAVDAGRPALLLTDLYYLDHYGSSAHFPGHAVVLAGYDDEVAYLSDTGFEELQTTAAREPRPGPPRQAPGVPARRPHAHGRRGRPSSRDVRAAPARAIERNARQMIEPPLGEYEGLPALRRFAAEVGDWPQRARGLAVVRALLLPGDRAPRNRRRQLPAHVLALPRGGGRREARRSRPRRPRAGPRSPRPCSPPARPTSPSRELWSRDRRRGGRGVLDAEERLWPALAG